MQTLSTVLKTVLLLVSPKNDNMGLYNRPVFSKLVVAKAWQRRCTILTYLSNLKEW